MRESRPLCSKRCKLPRPTRFLPPCGGRSLLEGGAFPKRHCAPRPHAWTRPGFLLPSLPRRGRDFIRLPLRPRLGLSRRFNSRCSRALPPSEGRESTPFAVVVPEYRTRYSRATGAGLLATPTDPGLCEDGSVLNTGRTGATSCGFVLPRTALLPSLPLASLALEEGGSALPATAESYLGLDIEQSVGFSSVRQAFRSTHSQKAPKSFAPALSAMSRSVPVRSSSCSGIVTCRRSSSFVGCS